MCADAPREEKVRSHPQPSQALPASTDRLAAALRAIGHEERTTEELVALLKRYEAQARRMAPEGFDVRECVTGPILDAVFGRGHLFTKRLKSGLELSLRYSSKIARDFLLSDDPEPDHVWEPQTTRTLLELTRDARHVVIGGAYMGDQAVPVADRLRGRGTVHCFEPSPDSAGLLAENARQNKLHNVVINEIALWSDPRVRLALVGDDAHAAPQVAPDGLATTTLETYGDANGIAEIQLIMLDVEGGELAALQGGQRFLEQPADRAPHVIFEIHGAYTDWSAGITQTDIVRFLTTCGYRIFAIRDYQSNVAMNGSPIELVELDSIHTDGPTHGFNMLAIKRPDALDPTVFRRVRGVSPKLLFHRNPTLHAPLTMATGDVPSSRLEDNLSRGDAATNLAPSAESGSRHFSASQTRSSPPSEG